MMTPTTASAPPTCEARTGYTPGAFRFEPVRCHTTIGLRSFVNVQGETHFYCAAPGHEPNVRLSNGGIGEMRPSMTPNPRCESGSRPGCTCDVCF